MRVRKPKDYQKQQKFKKLVHNDYTDLDEEEKNSEERSTDKRSELNELISELTANEIRPQLLKTQIIPEIDEAH